MNRVSLLERLAPFLPEGVTADAAPASVTLTINGEDYIKVSAQSLELAYIKACRMLPPMSKNVEEMATSNPTWELLGQMLSEQEGEPAHTDDPLAHISVPPRKSVNYFGGIRNIAREEAH